MDMAKEIIVNGYNALNDLYLTLFVKNLQAVFYCLVLEICAIYLCIIGQKWRCDFFDKCLIIKYMCSFLTSFFGSLIPLTDIGAVIILTQIIIGCLNEPAYYELTMRSNFYKLMIVDSIKRLQLGVRRLAQVWLRWCWTHRVNIYIATNLLGLGCDCFQLVSNPTDEAQITVMIDLLGIAHEIDKQQREKEKKPCERYHLQNTGAWKPGCSPSTSPSHVIEQFAANKQGKVFTANIVFQAILMVLYRLHLHQSLKNLLANSLLVEFSKLQKVFLKFHLDKKCAYICKMKETDKT